MDLFPELNRLMVKYRFKPSRKLAQNFVVDERLLELMVFHAELKRSDVVLEIGAGCGFLTRKLQEKCRVIAVERDDTLFEVLGKELNKRNLTLVHGDFLEAKLPEFSKVVALPPYTVSSKIIYRLVGRKFGLAVLVFQKEFCSKLTAEPGFADYGAISVISQYYSEPKILIENISPSAFYPKPKSFSSLIKLSCRKRFGSSVNDALFELFLKSVFRFKNKNLCNALHMAYPFVREASGVGEAEYRARLAGLELCGKKLNLIGVGDFVRIFNSVFG